MLTPPTDLLPQRRTRRRSTKKFRQEFPAEQSKPGMTTHARKRAQQRCIPDALIDFVIRFGSVKFDDQHGERYFFDKRSRRRLRTYLGPWMYASVEERLDVFVVMVEGLIVTCGWQTKRLHKN